MNRRRRAPRGGLKSRELRWTGDMTTALTNVPINSLSFIDLVVPGDYRQSATLEAGNVTLMRIRGIFSYKTAAVLDGMIHAGIFVHDATYNPAFGVTLDPGLFTSFIEPNLLWHYGAIGGLVDDAFTVPIDVKVKRKMVNQNITFVCTARTQSFDFGVTGRCLMLGG